ncbi:TIGR04222 domain-containing membrane protein [Streptomyces sp. NBC_01498]|uniref:TIGR04222 domain-containing membrane protein n=1 Tax=Streptomyces sp. NBC_01498 TaxID=2975870 RepID=UPI002E7BF9DE|nr:TIGR04222 domain-containing membrane protein [Streptomyces sp. NBC_01498]WTL25863.1 TIGR04222 domain-containing membrane protein [Streptomyces sp. NBC_01498]
MRKTIRRRVSAAERPLDAYEVAYLAGGPQRVCDTALFALRDRGAVTVAGPRVRPAEEGDGLVEHPVEEAVLAACPWGRSLAGVAASVRGGPEVAEIRRTLVALGLLTLARRRPTRAGVRRLEEAKRAGTFPAYVIDGPPAHPDRRLRRVVAATSVPSGLGRSLIRLANSTDPDRDRDTHHDQDTGSGSGGFDSGGGGGGGSD